VRLVTEFQERHGHCENEAAYKNVEDTRHVAERQLVAGSILWIRRRNIPMLHIIVQQQGNVHTVIKSRAENLNTLHLFQTPNTCHM